MSTGRAFAHGTVKPNLYRMVTHTKGTTMSDDLKKRGSEDRRKIAMQEPHGVRYWTEKFGKSMEELQRIVDKVGNSASTVRNALGKS